MKRLHESHKMTEQRQDDRQHLEATSMQNAPKSARGTSTLAKDFSVVSMLWKID